MSESSREREVGEGSGALVVPGVRVGVKLGEGTLAEVFRGTQRSLSRSVAVKVLKPSITPASQLGKRFLREASILSKLSHQNVPHVYEAGDADGRPFIVMELIEGPSLRKVMDAQGALPVDTAVSIAHEIAGALAHVHALGFVHRDVKPANILLSRRGDVKLTDFGIARDTSEPHDGLGVVGTPSYMSPEQVLGDRVDFRSDLFSLGILLYEMLTGRRPFEEEAGRTVMQKIRLDRYPSPSSLRSGVSTVIERILARCLEKNPANRYDSADTVTRDLGDYLASRGAASTRALVLDRLLALKEVTNAEVRAALGPSGFKDGAAASRAAHEDRAVLRAQRAMWLGQAASAAALIALVAYTEATRERTGDAGRTATGPRPPGTADVGRLRVVARPWANVTIDGIAVETAPTNESFRLLPGLHYVRFAHPTLGTLDRVVRVESGATVWLEVNLEGAQR
ncbi:MAG: serine/threonine-protein kinase [Polyangiales bacterium]